MRWIEYVLSLHKQSKLNELKWAYLKNIIINVDSEESERFTNMKIDIIISLVIIIIFLFYTLFFGEILKIFILIIVPIGKRYPLPS